MNRTTVKRGIGAVILALIAATLLAFLLKDKAAQRQEVVEIPLPGTGGSTEVSDQSTRLPTLTMDNSGNGNVVANAGSGNGNESASIGTVDGSATTSKVDGAIIASAAAIGATAGGAATDSPNSTKDMDFSVKPKASKASSEFLNLDLVNNGNDESATSKSTAKAVATTSTAETTPAATKSPTKADEGVVIASTSPKSSGSTAKAVQPRLINERKVTPIKSAKTAKVITKKTKAVAKAIVDDSATASTAKNGFTIQLLATSSAARANNLKKVMAKEGYPTRVTQTKQNGKVLYRVRIGKYATKTDAVKAQAAMKRRYKKNTNINRSAIVAR